MATTTRLWIKVSGNGVSIYHCDEAGQLNATHAGNRPGQTLRDVIRERWGHPNVLLVEDAEFGHGVYSVGTYCSAGGHGWGYRLELLMSAEEITASHQALVDDAKAGRQPTGKIYTALAFDRLMDRKVAA